MAQLLSGLHLQDLVLNLWSGPRTYANKCSLASTAWLVVLLFLCFNCGESGHTFANCLSWTLIQKVRKRPSLGPVSRPSLGRLCNIYPTDCFTLKEAHPRHRDPSLHLQVQVCLHIPWKPQQIPPQWVLVESGAVDSFIDSSTSQALDILQQQKMAPDVVEMALSCHHAHKLWKYYLRRCYPGP